MNGCDGTDEPKPPSMDLNARQEQFANAFLVTVAAVAGFTAAKPDVDNDSVDWTIAESPAPPSEDRHSDEKPAGRRRRQGRPHSL